MRLSAICSILHSRCQTLATIRQPSGPPDERELVDGDGLVHLDVAANRSEPVEHVTDEGGRLGPAGEDGAGSGGRVSRILRSGNTRKMRPSTNAMCTPRCVASRSKPNPAV